MYVFSAQALAHGLVLHKPLHTAYTALCRKAAMSATDRLHKCDPAELEVHGIPFLGPWHTIPPSPHTTGGQDIELYFLFPAGSPLSYLCNGGMLSSPEVQNHANTKSKSDTTPFLTSDFVGQNLDKVLPVLLLQHAGQQRVLRETTSTSGLPNRFKLPGPRYESCPRVGDEKTCCEMVRVSLPRALWDEGLRNKTFEPCPAEPSAKAGLYQTKAIFDLTQLEFTKFTGKITCQWQPQNNAKEFLMACVSDQNRILKMMSEKHDTLKKLRGQDESTNEENYLKKRKLEGELEQLEDELAMIPQLNKFAQA